MSQQTSPRTHWVHDYETLSNCFVACFEDFKDDNNTKTFVATTGIDGHIDLIEFLNRNKDKGEYHISYNGLAFDSQITEHIIRNQRRLLKLSGLEFAEEMYEVAQRTINKQNRKEFSEYPQWKLSIPQIDIFKLNHWDNPAKSSSLKWIQYSIDWKNMQEMPIHHTTEIRTQEELDMIISYCINDVKSTKSILHLSREQIELRAQLSKEYGMDLLCASEPRISKEIFAYFLCKKIPGLQKSTLKQLRTPRSSIKLSECILPYVKFNTPVFQSVLDFFMSKTVTDTKGSLNFSINYKGVKTDYGLGGIHGCREAGVYEPTTGWTIMTSDVASYYPNLAIKNGFAPEHLPKNEFLELYEWFFDERKLIPKKDPRNYVYKIVLNATYGLSNDANSFLYDPKFTMQITINGQLQLSKLYEMLCEGIPEAIPLMQNTDGLEMMIPDSKKDLYMEICDKWQQLTKLTLEHDEYRKMVIADVNNYIAIPKDSTKEIKCKGRFEWQDLEKKKVAILHKNKSFLIIPKAVYAYFVHGTKPEDFIANNKNLLDYCGAVKSKGDWKVNAVTVNNGQYVKDELQKINRYYISKDGVKLVKMHPDGREIQIEAGRWKQIVVNDLTSVSMNVDDNSVDYDYYLSNIYNEINNIDKKISRGFQQMELF